MSGDLSAHHFVAMRAKEDGDYAKVLNAALDMWDRFGLCWEVADALFDGFLVWRNIDDFDRQEAFDLAIGLYHRARQELPADLANAPLPDRTVVPPHDVVTDWASLFNLAEWYFDTIPPEDRRALAQHHFDEVISLPQVLIAEYWHWLKNLNEKYDVGDMRRVWQAHDEVFRERPMEP